MTSGRGHSEQYVEVVARVTTTMALTLALVSVGRGPAWAAMPPAAGARPLVAVVRAAAAEGGPRHDDATQEIATRVIAELMAAGIAVMAVACGTDDPACLAPSQPGLLATVMVSDQPSGPALEIKAAGLATGTARAWRLGAEADGESRPAALAVRTVELVRALLLEPPPGTMAVGDDAVRSEPTQDLREDADTDGDDDDDDDDVAWQQGEDDPLDDAVERKSKPPPPPAFMMAASVGMAVMGSFAGIGASYGPTLRFVRRTSEHVALSVFLAGPLFASKLEAPTGTVRVRQEMLAAEVSLTGKLGPRVQSRAGLGAGAYHIAVNGNVYDRGSGRQEGAFCVAITWSLGLMATLRPDLGLFVDGAMVLLTPTPVVLLQGFELGRAGNPGVLVSSGIEWRF
jgi:hypothetical protein